MNTAYFYLTSEGKDLAERLALVHPGDLYGKEHFKENLREAFSRYDALVCIMAAGIAVRILAPLLDKKTRDPAVVVMDQQGRHAISLLSGHLGGANDLAREMAAICGADPVITTATDVAGVLSFDTFAKEKGLAIENIGCLKQISGALLERKRVSVITSLLYPELRTLAEEGSIDLISWEDFKSFLCRDPEGALKAYLSQPAVLISEYMLSSVIPAALPSVPILCLRPRSLCAGIGCKRDTKGEAIYQALLQVLKEEGLSPLSLKCLCTIPLKADEPGIVETAARLSLPLRIIPTEEIEALDIQTLGIASSSFVAAAAGVPSVSTASAYLASDGGLILRDKVKFRGITVALCLTSSPYRLPR